MYDQQYPTTTEIIRNLGLLAYYKNIFGKFRTYC
jgi:hypothetical protein